MDVNRMIKYLTEEIPVDERYAARTLFYGAEIRFLIAALKAAEARRLFEVFCDGNEIAKVPDEIYMIESGKVIEAEKAYAALRQGDVGK